MVSIALDAAPGAARYTTPPEVAVLASLVLAAAVGAPLALHPANPRYFLFRGKPAVLVTSGEHYGAVLNTTRRRPTPSPRTPTCTG